MHIVTVKFTPSDKSQTELQNVLLIEAGLCEFDGIIHNVTTVEDVFPDKTDPKFKGIFLVRFESANPDKVLERFKVLPGVDKAYFTPFRGWP